MAQHKTNPKLKTTWVDIAPNFLRHRNNRFNVPADGSKKNNLVFVESKDDKDFYKTAIEDEVEVGNIIPCEFSKTMNIEDFGRLYYFDKSEGRYINCEFIKKIAEEFAEKKEAKYKNIDCFGFVDRDFNVGQSLCNNYEFTTCHDYETTLFYLYFPKYYKNNKEEIDIEKLSNLLSFTTKQGILQMCSKSKDWGQISNALMYVSLYNFYPEKLSDAIPKQYGGKAEIKNAIEISTLLSLDDDLSYNFNDYLENIATNVMGIFSNWEYEEYPYNIKVGDDKYKEYKQFFYDTFNEYFSEDKFNFRQETENWLREEKNNIVKAFQYINGHILFDKIKQGFKSGIFEKLKNELKNNVSLLKNDNPVKKFLEYLDKKSTKN